MQWLFDEPTHWHAENGTLTVTTAPKTDFWRKTHSGNVANNGHFYYQDVSGDFTAEVKFTGQYRDLYDQAGLMVRIDDEHWIKTGIELYNGMQHASAVVTRDFSDWSIVPLPQNPPSLWLRLQRSAHTIEISFSLDGEQFTMFRQAYFPPVETIQVGMMACAPTGSGLTVSFENFRIG